MAARSGLPSGTVTFLFTDIEGSTELLKQLGRDRYETVLTEHDDLLRAAVAAHDGRVVDTQGDSLFGAFRSAREAVSAAIEAQRELAAHEWPDQLHVRVRMGLHSGEPKAGDQGYVGIGVHRAARVGAAAHGGQILLSETARALVADDLPAGVSLRDLGVHRLKDIDEPARLYQVVTAGLQERFPPLRTVRRGRSRRAYLVLAMVALVIAAGATAVVLLATGLASAKPVRLHANSIAVIDAKSGKPVGDVPLAFSPTDVNASGNEIWVLNWLGRTATAIDPSTLKVIQTVGVDGDPLSQYAIGDTDWVGIPGGVDVLDTQADSNNATKISLWEPSGGSTRCYVYVTGNGRTVWVSEGTNVAVIDAASGNVLRKLHLPTPSGVPPSLTCYGLRYSDGVLLAIRGPDFSIGSVDLRSASYTPIANEPSLTPENFGGGSANWVAGFGSYWVGTWTNSTSGTATNLTRFDPISGTATSKIASPRPAGSQPNDLPGFNRLAVDRATGVWALEEPFINALAHIDPTTSQITSTTPLGHTVCCPVGGIGNGVAVGHGRVWVGLDSP